MPGRRTARAFLAATCLAAGLLLPAAGPAAAAGTGAVADSFHVAAQGRGETLADFFGPTPLIVVFSVTLAIAVAGVLAGRWWLTGRDHWFGDRYLGDEPARESIKPPFSHETVVVQYAPPRAPGQPRPLRPAEVGLLLDERPDMLDLSATIIDLAVRGYVGIDDLPRHGLLAGQDRDLTKLKPPDDGLLPYERRLLWALFGHGTQARLSDLEGRLAGELRRVKYELCKEAVETHHFFPSSPEMVRDSCRATGAVIIGGVGPAVLLLGAAGAGLLGMPFLLGGIALMLLAPVMPRRTALGRQVYRQILGFRLYMMTAEKDRQRFAERTHVFTEYLPYAMVLGCVQKWAAAFRELDEITNRPLIVRR